MAGYNNLKIKVYKTVILPVVLYGCETWSLTLREEHILKVFENRVLSIFGPKREEDGSWRKLHNDKLYSLYCLPNIVRVRFPAGVGNFSLHHRVQNGSGAHPASYPIGTRCSFSGGEAVGT
jgi:hypothetical protein